MNGHAFNRWTPDVDYTPVVHTGPARSDWCVRCKAWTLVVADLFLVGMTGVRRIGDVSQCEVYGTPEEHPPTSLVERMRRG